MKKANYKSALKDAKKAMAKLGKFTDFRGLNTKKNYSSFWMDNEWDNQAKFSGLTTTTGAKYTSSNDTVKLVKLSNYRRAITNFVKIVTKKDIPVLWAGSESYTNGKAITLSTDIKDNNFDVTVGLALHEASHIILSDFELVMLFKDRKIDEVETLINAQDISLRYGLQDAMFGLLNWVEDRRIDNFIFTTSPGYKAYYHKLYDYYWNSKDIAKGLLSKKYRDAQELDSWMFHIINSISPDFNVKALPKLNVIMSIIDLPNISRLKTTRDALEVVLAVTEVIQAQRVIEQQNQQNQSPQNQPPQNGSQPDDQQSSQSSNQGGGQDSGDDKAPDNDDGQTAEGTDSQTDAPTMELTPAEEIAIQKTFKEQKDFMENGGTKKGATKSLQKSLEKVASQQIDIQQVGGESGVKGVSALIVDLTASGKMAEAHDLTEKIKVANTERAETEYNSIERKALDKELGLLKEQRDALGMADYLSSNNRYKDNIALGLEMGGLLGKKLQLHNESRERVDNRLRSGRIDNKRLAHAGYGIENVFSQIHIDKYKKANLHISLDGSGSMSGSKWGSAIEMTVAIVKAANYTQNINVQVSVRVTDRGSKNEAPMVLNVFDSRKNNIKHLTTFFSGFNPSSMTPEGLCFEAMYRKGQFMSSNSEMDSYFLNVSDGQPGCGDYCGVRAHTHTAKWINKMKNELSVKVLSFWITDPGKEVVDKALAYSKLVQQFGSSGDGQAFRSMYGKDASVVDSSNAIMIAKELNKKFMARA